MWLQEEPLRYGSALYPVTYPSSSLLCITVCVHTSLNLQAFESVMNNPDLSAMAEAARERDSGVPSGAAANVCAEYLSIYVDEHMKGLFKGASEAELDDKLTKARAHYRMLSVCAVE